MIIIQKKISDLPSGSTLTGDEMVPIFQSGQTKQVLTSELMAPPVILIGENFTAQAGKHYYTSNVIDLTTPASPTEGQTFSLTIVDGMVTVDGDSTYGQANMTTVFVYQGSSWVPYQPVAAFVNVAQSAIGLSNSDNSAGIGYNEDVSPRWVSSVPIAAQFFYGDATWMTAIPEGVIETPVFGNAEMHYDVHGNEIGYYFDVNGVAWSARFAANAYNSSNAQGLGTYSAGFDATVTFGWDDAFAGWVTNRNISAEAIQVVNINASNIIAAVAFEGDGSLLYNIDYANSAYSATTSQMGNNLDALFDFTGGATRAAATVGFAAISDTGTVSYTVSTNSGNANYTQYDSHASTRATKTINATTWMGDAAVRPNSVFRFITQSAITALTVTATGCTFTGTPVTALAAGGTFSLIKLSNTRLHWMP